MKSSQADFFSIKMCNYRLQVSLAIRWGRVPEKFQTANTKTGILCLI